MKRIVGIIAIIVGVSLAASWYVHREKLRALNSGDVFVREVPPDNPAPSPAPPAASTVQHTPPQPTAAPGGAQPPTVPSPVVASIPSSDSIARNPPNGVVFAGGGKFQLYRQGDITWRLNTETGQACILFATNNQWSHNRVFQHGCAYNPQASAAIGN